MIEPRADTAPRREKKGPPRDHTTVGAFARPDFVRLPDPTTMFTSRSRRFASLATADQPLAPYLRFLSHLSDAQHRMQAAIPEAAAARPGHLQRQDILAGDDLAARITWLARDAATSDAPPATDQARTRLAAMAASEQIELATGVLNGLYRPDRLAESLYVAAALQVHLAHLASRLSAVGLTSAGEGVCPACGGPPVASLIAGWRGADRTRYCCCALCGTFWNAVRAKCTACSSTAGVSYATFEDQSQDIAAETCSACDHYIKHLRQDRTPELDPVADDIASLGLDLRLQATGLRRATQNPLMVIQEP